MRLGGLYSSPLFFSIIRTFSPISLLVCDVVFLWKYEYLWKLSPEQRVSFFLHIFIPYVIYTYNYPPPSPSKSHAKLVHFGKKYFTFFKRRYFPLKRERIRRFIFSSSYRFLSGFVTKTGETGGFFVRQISHKETNARAILPFTGGETSLQRIHCRFGGKG
jgi:hypothetical protein